MIETSFNNTQLTVLLASLLFVVLSIIAQVNGRFRLSLILLIIGGFGINCFMALLDPFLNDWDERFHALVAKNVMENPLRPILFTEHPLPYDYKNWTDNEIWMHKQPLFLWQIAFCFKLFGVNEFVLRMPNIIMGTILIPVLYRMGKILFNQEAGYISALLFAMSIYHLEMIAGIEGTEHNTFAFIFYVTLCLWSWLEYTFSGKKFWLLAMGIFAGFAVLNKWLTGLWVFGGWGLFILFDSERRYQLKSYIELAVSLIIAVLVFIPWQFYTRIKYPVESKYEIDYNSRHIFEVLEGHGGSSWFYFQKLPLQYGEYFVWIIPIAFIAFIIFSKNRLVASSILINVGVVFFFFSVIVQTKLNQYTIMVFSVVFLALGIFFQHFLSFTKIILPKYSQILIALLLMGISFLAFNLNKIERNHTAEKSNYYGIPKYRENKIFNTELYKKIPDILGGEKYVIFNCKPFENVDLSFYTGYRGYPYFPDSITIANLKLTGNRVAVFNKDYLPDYILNDTEIFIIQSAWQ